nr:immunoglobulin heavy chain junction region [Mus musculus]
VQDRITTVVPGLLTG